MKCSLLCCALVNVLVCIFSMTGYGQVNYFNYHNHIIRAEHAFFVNNNPKGAFQIYDELIGKYPFHFGKDYYLAAQIACKYGDSNRVYNYLDICFKQGLDINHLSLSPVFVLQHFDHTNRKVQELYQRGNREYRKNIDTNYRKKIYQLYAQDQVDKSLSTMKYNDILAHNMQDVVDWVRKRGFPSDRTIGVDDAAMQIGGRNLRQWYLHACSVNGIAPNEHIGYADDHSLSSCVALYFMIHHPCAYQYLEPFIRAEIKNGNLHPRDAGLLHDNMIGMAKLASDKKLGCQPRMPDGPYFKLNSFVTYPNNWRDNRLRIDSLRKQFSIASLDHDSIKRSKIKQLNFYNKFGFWGCR